MCTSGVRAKVQIIVRGRNHHTRKTSQAPLLLFILRILIINEECLLAVRDGMPGDEIVRLLELSREAYECCEDAVGVRDVCYMAARVRHMRGEVAERNAVAGGFKKMVQLLSRRQSQLSY